MKRALLTVLVVAVTALAVAAAVVARTVQVPPNDGYRLLNPLVPATATAGPQVLILHSYFACHTLSVGGRAQASQTIVISQGKSFTVHNHDLASHSLVHPVGPDDLLMRDAATGAPSDGVLVHGGNTVKVTLFTAGTYGFTTVEADHQQPLVEVLGDAYQVPDNQLALKVIVLPTMQSR